MVQFNSKIQSMLFWFRQQYLYVTFDIHKSKQILAGDEKLVLLEKVAHKEYFTISYSILKKNYKN